MDHRGVPQPDEADPGAGILPTCDRDAADILRAVARMSPLPMVLADPYRPDMPAVFCNAAFTRLTGYAEDEVIGRNLRLLQGPETDDRALDTLRLGIAAQREIQVELWNYRQDGTKFWCSMFVGPVFDGNGRLLFWFGSQLDAGARRELDQAQARAQRMDTLGAMAAGIAHEFNNLMTVVLANAESAGTESLTPRQAERLNRVSWAARTAGRLTQQMLAFAGRQVLQSRLVDLNDVVRGADGLLAQLAPAGVPLDLSLAAVPLPAVIDAAKLEMALINLVRNAADASAPGNPILVQTGPAVLDGAPAVEVAVIDHGTGMPPDVASRATEPFFTTKHPGSGTGLGLSMVSGFAEQSRGAMLVHSEQGRGTTVRLVFPRSDAPPI